MSLNWNKMIEFSSEKNIKTVVKFSELLTISFDDNWFQEDIETLIELVFKPLMPVNIQEKILGADRENIRFTWRQHYFILNFDYYSQSCWIEGQDDKSNEHLDALYEELKVGD